MSNKSTVTRPRNLRGKMQAEVDLGFSWGLANSFLLALGVGVLIAGYVALSRGSVTLAPALLVLGYCGLIPASLLVRGRSSEPGE